MTTTTPATHQTWLEMVGSTGIVAAVAAVLVVVLTAYFAASASRRKERAERYAAMVVTLTNWTEFPYRVRRRLSDDVHVMSALSERIHELQEKIVLDGAELAAECPWLSKRYERAMGEIKTIAAPFLNEAWDTPADGSLGSMNLNDWGPKGLDVIVLRWRSELRWRFGWRRLINPLRLAWEWSGARRNVTTAEASSLSSSTS